MLPHTLVLKRVVKCHLNWLRTTKQLLYFMPKLLVQKARKRHFKAFIAIFLWIVQKFIIKRRFYTSHEKNKVELSICQKSGNNCPHLLKWNTSGAFLLEYIWYLLLKRVLCIHAQVRTELILKASVRIYLNFGCMRLMNGQFLIQQIYFYFITMVF